MPPVLEQLFSSREDIILDINTGFVVFPSAPERGSSSFARLSRRDQTDKASFNPDLKQATKLVLSEALLILISNVL